MEDRSSVVNIGDLIRRVVMRFGLAFIILGAVFFATAGTFCYWHAWLYMAVLFVPMFFVLLYLVKKDPALLERRLRTKERVVPQNFLHKITTAGFILSYIVPGFDHRFGWSSVPNAVVVAADILVFLSYSLFFLVLRENSYASRIVEVEKDQRVISTGPYAVVRHPMYSAVLVMFLMNPIALGSFWALLCLLPLPGLLVTRIRNEEKLLINDLSGYKEYTQAVKYRLVPGVW